LQDGKNSDLQIHQDYFSAECPAVANVIVAGREAG